MIEDIANYDKLYEDACIKFVQEGNGTVSDFCNRLNLSEEHKKCFELALDKFNKATYEK